MSGNLVGNKTVDHSDVFGAALFQLLLHLDLTPGSNELGKGNYKTRRKTYKFGDLVRIILEVWR